MSLCLWFLRVLTVPLRSKGGLLNAPFHRGPWGGATNAVEGAPEWQVRLYDVAVRIGSLPDEFIMVLAYLVMCPRYGMLFKLKRV